MVGLFPATYRHGLHGAISAIPNTDRSWILKATLNRYQSSTPEELVNIITLLPSVPKAERKRFLEIAYSFEGGEPSVILPLLSRIQTAELHPLIRDVRANDPSGKWLLTALPIDQMQFVPTAKRPHMFERVKAITQPLLYGGRLSEEDRFTRDEINKLHDITGEQFDALRVVFGEVLENPHGILHKVLQLPADDFQALGDFIRRFRTMYRPQRNSGFFFPLLDVRPSDREMCLDVWQRIMTLSDIPTDANAFHLKLMKWPINEVQIFITMYQSFLTETMPHHDRRVLLDHFLYPESHCHSQKFHHFPVKLIEAVGRSLDRDISAGLEERHRFTRLVDLIENPESSLSKYFELERAKEQLLRDQRALAQRMEEQRERERLAREEYERQQQERREYETREKQRLEEARVREQQARQRLEEEQRARARLMQEQRALDQRAQAFPAFRDWVMGQEAMTRERDAVTDAVLAVWNDSDLQKYKPLAHEVEKVFREKFCDPITRIINLRMQRIINENISARNAPVYVFLMRAAFACIEEFTSRDPRFYRDTRFFHDEKSPALHQFFWGLRNAGDVTREDEAWTLGLLERAYNKDPEGFMGIRIPEGFAVEKDFEGNPIPRTPPVPFTEWFAKFRTKLVPCLKEMQNLLRHKEYFRVETALRGLDQVMGIRGDYAYDTGRPGVYVPELRIFCGFLGNLAAATLTPEGFVQGWMTEHWKNPLMTRVFPELRASASFGEALGLNPTLQHQMVGVLTSALRDRETILPHSLPLIARATKAYYTALFDPFDAVVDALFMTRRGHTGQGHKAAVKGEDRITNPLWLDQYACADGVAVGLFRTTTENALTQVLASSLIGITLVNCHRPR